MKLVQSGVQDSLNQVLGDSVDRENKSVLERMPLDISFWEQVAPSYMMLSKNKGNSRIFFFIKIILL